MVIYHPTCNCSEIFRFKNVRIFLHICGFCTYLLGKLNYNNADTIASLKELNTLEFALISLDILRRQNECHQRGESCCAVKSSRTGFVAIQPLAGITSARTHCLSINKVSHRSRSGEPLTKPSTAPVSTLYSQPIRFTPSSWKSPLLPNVTSLPEPYLDPKRTITMRLTLHSPKPLLWRT